MSGGGFSGFPGQPGSSASEMPPLVRPPASSPPAMPWEEPSPAGSSEPVPFQRGLVETVAWFRSAADYDT
jgi:chromosome partitioning protein